MIGESGLWRAIARQIHDDPRVGLYGALDLSRALDKAADERLRTYDAPGWCYGPDDAYANMDGADRVLAALWLALEAEDEFVSAVPAPGADPK